MRTRESVLRKHYQDDGLLLTACQGNAKCRALSDRLLSSLKSLTQIPFKLDPLYETRQLHQSLLQLGVSCIFFFFYKYFTNFIKLFIVKHVFILFSSFSLCYHLSNVWLVRPLAWHALETKPYSLKGSFWDDLVVYIEVQISVLLSLNIYLSTKMIMLYYEFGKNC